MVEKYIITGGPSSGKTTIIKSLKNKGFLTFPEAARTIIDRAKRKGHLINTFQGNVRAFQDAILNLQIKNEKRADKLKGKIFFDRGLPDGIAYYKFTRTKINPRLLEESKKEKRNYNKIFFLETGAYFNDSDRKEPKKVAEKLKTLTFNVYKKLGYKIIMVPFIGIKKRTAFILNNLK